MKMHFTEMVCVVVVLGYVMGSPPAKRTALTIGSHGQSELRKRELLQTYLNFFYASARLAGFTDDRIFGGAPENKGNMFQ